MGSFRLLNNVTVCVKTHADVFTPNHCVYHFANMIVSLATLLPIAIAYRLGDLMKHSCYNYHLESMELGAPLPVCTKSTKLVMHAAAGQKEFSVFMLSF